MGVARALGAVDDDRQAPARVGSVLLMGGVISCVPWGGPLARRRPDLCGSVTVSAPGARSYSNSCRLGLVGAGELPMAGRELVGSVEHHPIGRGGRGVLLAVLRARTPARSRDRLGVGQDLHV